MTCAIAAGATFRSSVHTKEGRQAGKMEGKQVGSQNVIL